MQSQSTCQRRLEATCESLFELADQMPAQVIDEENGRASLWAITQDGYVIKIDSIEEHYWIFTLKLMTTATDSMYTTDPSAERAYKEVPEYIVTMLQRAVPVPGMQNLMWGITDNAGIAEIVTFYRPVHQSQQMLSMALFVRRNKVSSILQNRLFSRGHLDPLEFWNCVREKVVKSFDYNIFQSRLPNQQHCIVVEGQTLAHPGVWQKLDTDESISKRRPGRL